MNNVIALQTSESKEDKIKLHSI